MKKAELLKILTDISSCDSFKNERFNEFIKQVESLPDEEGFSMNIDTALITDDESFLYNYEVEV